MFLKSVISIMLIILNSGLQPEFLFEKELSQKADFITTDQLGNIYLIKNTEISKINFTENKQQKYSNVLTGKITSVDATDPFRILLFYKDFGQLVFLDRNLTEIISPVSLNNFGYYNVVGACQSINGGFWIFDQSLYQLVYFDKSLNTISKSTQLQEQIGQIEEQNQVFMLEKNNYIYLGINKIGILLFDQYGTYIKTFPVKYSDSFQVINDNILYLNNGNWCIYNMNNFEETVIKLPVENVKQACYNNHSLTINTKEKILIYKVNNF